MASVNDYGGPTDSLASVPLGGVGGWAEAVAAALGNSDTPVDQRGTFVKKTGDTMTGRLGISGGSTFAAGHLRMDATDLGHAGLIRFAGLGVGFVLDDANSSGGSADRLPIIVANPTRVDHATTKAYVDGTDASPTFTSPFIKRSGHRAAFRKAGGMVLCQMSLDVTSNVASSGVTVSVGTVPVGYRPAEYCAMSATWVNPGSAPGNGLLIAYPDGQFRLLIASGQTLVPGTHVAASGSWPPA